MGLMIDGKYHAEDPKPDTDADGEFKRKKSTIRNWITTDGAPGPTGTGGFAIDQTRYHLFAAWNCPWAHRTLLARAIKGLKISVSYALPRRTDQGWVFDPTGEFSDPLMDAASLHEVYAQVDPAYTGRITVPLLWDKDTGRAVSNESADIVRMLDQFDSGTRLAPEDLLDDIDRWNAFIYPNINNGVYRTGFARTQAAYDVAFDQLFDALDTVESLLETSRWLCGDRFTEADLRLFPTLARFDVAYHFAFKCNKKRLRDYPRLWTYARRIFAMPGIRDTVRFDIYKAGYFSASELRNPLGIVPLGPVVDWELTEQDAA